MKIVFIVDQLPFPPRNGITITLFNLLRGLAHRHQVGVLFLKPPHDEIVPGTLIANRDLFMHLWHAELTPVPRPQAILSELVGRAPYFASGQWNPPPFANELREFDPDVLWAAPIRAAAYLPHVERMLTHRRRLRIAAINDSYTASLRSYGHQIFGAHWNLHARMWGFLKWEEGTLMGRHEARILRQADLVLVQTEADRAWTGRISSGDLLARTHVLTNGTDLSLLQHPHNDDAMTWGHIGPLDIPRNARTARWLIADVFPRVRRRIPESQLLFLGRPGPESLSSTLKGCFGVQHVARVNAKVDFYDQVAAIVVRNYKHIGLISRTLEAMAAGVVVIGEPGAFNGIPGFISGTHGWIAQSARETAQHLVWVFSDPNGRRKMAAAARILVAREFRWEDRVDRAESLILRHCQPRDGEGLCPCI